MALGNCIGSIRGKPLNSWKLEEFPASNVFSPSIHTFILVHNTTKKMYIMGKNQFGKFGIGGPVIGETYIQYPTDMGYKYLAGTASENVKKIVGGSNSLYLLLNNGELYAAGYNVNGELGIGNTTNTSDFTRVGGTDLYSDVSCYNSTVLAVKSTGQLYGWGVNNNILSDDNKVFLKEPTLLGTASNWSKVYVGSKVGFAKNTSNEVFFKGESSHAAASKPADIDTNTTGIVNTEYVVRAGVILNGFFTNSDSIKTANNTYSELYVGASHTIAYNGSYYTWGEANRAGLGLEQGYIIQGNPPAISLLWKVDNTANAASTFTNTGIPFLWNAPTRDVLYLGRSISITTTAPMTFLYSKLLARGVNSNNVPLADWVGNSSNLKCSINATLFLNSNIIHACGDVRPFGASIDSISNMVIPVPISINGTLNAGITEFDVCNHASHGIIRKQNSVYFIGSVNANTIPNFNGITQSVKWIVKGP